MNLDRWVFGVSKLSRATMAGSFAMAKVDGAEKGSLEA